MNCGAIDWTVFAAWVQALGSIVAILAGFAVAAWQIRESREAARRRDALAVRDMKRRCLMLAGIAADRVRRAHAGMVGLSSPASWAELRFIRSAIENDLQALLAFHPETSDVELLGRYLTPRGLLAQAMEQFEVASRAVSGANRIVVSDVSRELTSSLARLEIEAAKALVFLQEHLSARTPEDIA